ncbi:hypothetical protein [Brevundimonas sp.]|uniref:hypothetical protein n=1 Tax=Brevundimonas sp. TaxID=1871086 RepID=UPI002EDA7A24
MNDDHGRAGAWFGLALAAMLAAAPGLAAGGAPLLPLFLAGVGLACCLHGPSRRLVMDKALAVFSGPAARTLVLLAGAILMIQVLPFELALLMAGDVLAYMEVVAAVGLIAAHARLPLIRARLQGHVAATLAPMRRRLAARSPRPAMRRRRPARSADEDRAANGDLVWA